MQRVNSAEKAPDWIIDYSAARAKALEWLGDRYLLAKPVPRRVAGQVYGSPSRTSRPAPDLFFPGI